MKILIVSSWYPPIVSGSSLWTESLTDALRKRGHEVRVVTTCWKGMAQETNKSHQEIVYRFPAWVLPRSRFLLDLPIVPIAYSFANLRRMLEIVREFRPDVIHQINHIFDTLFLSAYAAKKMNIPLVGSITTPIQSESPLVQAIMHFADLGLVYHFGVRHWQRIVCSDSTQARYVLDSYGNRLEDRLVRHIFVGVHEWMRQGEYLEKKTWPQIVMIGHVHEIRDPTRLIQAMPLVLECFPNARLDIAGRVQFTEPVKEVKRLNLESSVRFLGEVPTEQVKGLLSSSHVFAILHQCKYAGLSFTAIEAMQCEIPVIINAPDDLYSGVLRDGENIVLVNGNDVKEIANKIINLLSNEKLRTRIGRNGKEFVDSYLNWDITAKKTEEMYEELLTK